VAVGCELMFNHLPRLLSEFQTGFLPLLPQLFRLVKADYFIVSILASQLLFTLTHLESLRDERNDDGPISDAQHDPDNPANPVNPQLREIRFLGYNQVDTQLYYVYCV
jgi:hypothetical protein